MPGSPLKRAKREMMQKLEQQVGTLVPGRKDRDHKEQPVYQQVAETLGAAAAEPVTTPQMHVPVPIEPRKPGDWKPVFVATLRDTGNVRYACQVSGVSRKTAYATREQDEAFALDWDMAFEDAVDLLESRAWVMSKVDGNMVRFLLQAHRPEIYARQLQVRHQGDKENPIQHNHVHTVGVYLPDNSRGDARIQTAELPPGSDDTDLEEVIEAEYRAMLEEDEPGDQEPDLEDDDDV
jgi:hypothetical protein